MIKDVEITNFRSFSKLRMSKLGQVNLIVGTNNCGKTCALEAIHALLSIGDTSAILHSCLKKGELLVSKNLDDNIYYEIDISHLFHGHYLNSDSGFVIKANDNGKKREVNVFIEQSSDHKTHHSSLTFNWTHRSDKATFSHRLSSNGGLSQDSQRYLFHIDKDYLKNNVQFISTKSLNSETIVQLFDEIALSDEEPYVIDALKIIQPDISQLATVMNTPSNSHGGIKAKLNNIKKPVPLGSMGDGIWRMLGLALSLVNAKDGTVLIDEIDTGLHHSVMTKMWELVFITAKRLNVQIFATTHSQDCIQSLAGVIQQENYTDKDVSIQRLEQGREESIPYSKDEIIVAANQHVEVR